MMDVLHTWMVTWGRGSARVSSGVRRIIVITTVRRGRRVGAWGTLRVARVLVIGVATTERVTGVLEERERLL